MAVPKYDELFNSARLGPVLVAAGWLAVIGAFYAQWLSHYYPHGDDWALLASSQIADFKSWWTGSLSSYFASDGQRDNSPFIRPFFNLVYCLFGLFFDAESPRRVWLGIAAIATCAGSCCFAARAAGSSQRAALVAGAILPLMPSFLPSRMVYAPYLAFDALSAALCLLAYVAYRRRRYLGSCLFLVSAVLMKETAAPIAAAIPAAFAWESRASLRRLDRTAWRSALLLLVPLAIWLALRGLAAPAIVENSYAFHPNLRAVVEQLRQVGWRWPFWIDRTSTPPAPVILAVGIANVLMIAIGTVFVAQDLKRDRSVSPEVACLLASYAFMLLVGREARYGAALWGFLVVCVARWHADGQSRAFATAAIVLIGVGGICGGALTLGHRTQDLDGLRTHWAECAGYTQTLREYGPQDRVLVLEDRCTLASHISALKKVARIDATLYKLGDANTPRRLRAPQGAACSWLLTPDPAHEREFTYLPSCGLDLAATRQRQSPQAVLKLADDIVARLIPPSHGLPFWSGAQLSIGPAVHVLMPDDDHPELLKDHYLR